MLPVSHHKNRLIPAHAGKTPSVPLPFFLLSAHPRSRGENPKWSARARAAKGSSPLTRGKHMHTGSPSQHHRLIPAHAGKTFAFRGVSLADTAHPRSRGENLSSVALVGRHVGSSPLTRGKRRGSAPEGDPGRLIPAHAGKTGAAAAAAARTAAHPRSRGENTS